MTSSDLGIYSNCLATPGEEPSPTSDSFSFGTLGDHILFEFLGEIVPATEKSNFRYYAKNING